MQGVCPTCGNTFTSRVKKTFCSHPCYAATIRGVSKAERVLFTCVHCGKPFEIAKSKVGKAGGRTGKYCSAACYHASEQFAKLHQANQERALANRPELECVICKKRFSVKPCEAIDKKRADGRKRPSRKFCSKLCWRQFFAERFDRWVASLEGLPLPQNYDEFLTKEKLPCLVEGCDWVGRHLGMHVNHAHGVTAEQFKEMAGFNRNTALVCPELAEELSASARNLGPTDPLGTNLPRLPPSTLGKYERRQEHKEHQSKAILLVAEEKRKLGLSYHDKMPVHP